MDINIKKFLKLLLFGLIMGIMASAIIVAYAYLVFLLPFKNGTKQLLFWVPLLSLQYGWLLKREGTKSASANNFNSR
ncbi:hypothetical protein SAMN05216383_1501 [Prevotella sp. KH2C16]|nr:hypothetical protein SAMN05216383_1501 [Prevotella sp. KH2C16]